MSSEYRRATVGDESIEYQVTYSDEATEPRIEVGIHGTTVVVPSGMDLDPDRLLEENGHWLREKRDQYDQYREQIPDRTFEPGETFPYLGEKRRLAVEPRQKSVVTKEEIRLRQSAITQSSVKRALRNFYRRESREYLSERLDLLADEMGLAYDGLQIRNQRTRWGSCSTNGTISLNWRLLMAPPEIIDYVVIHELAHLREPNHTDAFWSLVAEYEPDYEEHKEWLRANSSRLIFSEDDL